MEKNGKYIYCIIPSSVPVKFGPIGIGEQGDDVYAVNYESIAAVVSNSPKKEYKARRINISAHQKVLENVMEQFSILPVRFSTVTDKHDDLGIKKILEKDYKKFKSLLDDMNGKKELGVKAIFQEEVIFKHIVEKYDDIRSYKEKLMKLPADKTHAERFKIGEMVESALRQEADRLKAEFLDSLSPLCEEVKMNDNFGERMIMNGAFLIDQKNEKEFDTIMNDLAEEYGWLVTFKYVGSLPPYNFVNLVINLEEN